MIRFSGPRGICYGKADRVSVLPSYLWNQCICILTLPDIVETVYAPIRIHVDFAVNCRVEDN